MAQPYPWAECEQLSFAEAIELAAVKRDIRQIEQAQAQEAHP